MATTNNDLEKAVTEGTFREDLFCRLKVILVHISDLKDRPDDIQPLVQMFFTPEALIAGLLYGLLVISGMGVIKPS